MAHYKSATNEIYWYDTDAEFKQFAPAGLTPITDAEALAITNPAPTTAQIIALSESTAQSLLEATAKSWGYDSMLSAASYATSSVMKFKAESAALIAWRDSVWSTAIAIETAVPLVLPATTADFLALLPPVPVRP